MHHQFVLRNGAKVQIKRKKFENFIDQTSCI
ncbi:MAG: excisionase [Lachnospiraceae bacterium]